MMGIDIRFLFNVRDNPTLLIRTCENARGRIGLGTARLRVLLVVLRRGLGPTRLSSL